MPYDIVDAFADVQELKEKHNLLVMELQRRGILPKDEGEEQGESRGVNRQKPSSQQRIRPINPQPTRRQDEPLDEDILDVAPTPPKGMKTKKKVKTVRTVKKKDDEEEIDDDDLLEEDNENMEDNTTDGEEYEERYP